VSVAAQASSPCWLRYVSNALVVALPVTGVVIENGDYNDQGVKCPMEHGQRRFAATGAVRLCITACCGPAICGEAQPCRIYRQKSTKRRSLSAPDAQAAQNKGGHPNY
jgi:hypothetical protein